MARTKKVEETPVVKEPKDVKATAKTIRISARKVRLVLDLIRGKDVAEAMGILKLLPNHAAENCLKVLKSAVANATHNNQMDETKLYVKECYANEGITLKRYMPRAKGSASSIMKRTSHITIVVRER
ncbi:MAG: 50S ribosomal protein L22 [Firmicutes bacterium]|nr:50S ribosomal protein L22 [Candidatus Colivicinus equi]